MEASSGEETEGGGGGRRPCDALGGLEKDDGVLPSKDVLPASPLGDSCHDAMSAARETHDSAATH